MSARSDPDESSLVAWQLGRPARGRWRAVARCRFDRPQVIAVAPLLEDGTPFPTTFWLTCPHLVELVGRLESGGVGADMARAVADSPDLAACALAADAAYRVARAAANDGVDPCAETGIAGQSDPLAVKCLHARAAAFLAGVPDPVGGAVIGTIGESGEGVACADDRCAGAAAG